MPSGLAFFCDARGKSPSFAWGRGAVPSSLPRTTRLTPTLSATPIPPYPTLSLAHSLLSATPLPARFTRAHLSSRAPLPTLFRLPAPALSRHPSLQALRRRCLDNPPGPGLPRGTFRALRRRDPRPPPHLPPGATGRPPPRRLVAGGRLLPARGRGRVRPSMAATK